MTSCLANRDGQVVSAVQGNLGNSCDNYLLDPSGMLHAFCYNGLGDQHLRSTIDLGMFTGISVYIHLSNPAYIIRRCYPIQRQHAPLFKFRPGYLV